MSNRGGPSQKFVQTFFLAEQKSGYFVLNDIFRFLKEDIIDESVEDEVEEPVAEEEPVAVTVSDPVVEAPAPVRATVASPAVDHSSDTPGPASVEQDEATIQEEYALHEIDADTPIIVDESAKPAVDVPEPQSQIDEVPPVPLEPVFESAVEEEKPSRPFSWAALAAKKSAAAAAASPVVAAPAPAPASAPASAPVPAKSAPAKTDEKKRREPAIGRYTDV